MKRVEALQTLSRDHHQALFVALKLRRANTETAADAREAFLEYWRSHGRHHFRCEEEILLPTYAAHGDPRHPLVLEVLADHLVIRERAQALALDPAAGPQALERLGSVLANHVRLEERELFPLIETTLPQSQLDAVAAALEDAEAHGP